MNIAISLCRPEQLPALMRFIDSHWQKRHVLATDRRLMDWQHLSPSLTHYNFAIALDGATGEIAGALGFIPTAQFDSELEAAPHVWLALWKVRDEYRSAALGLRLMAFLTEIRPWLSMGAIGINEITVPLYRAMGFQVGKLDHFYIVNEMLSDFRLLEGFDGRYHSGQISDTASAEIVRLDAKDLAPFWDRAAGLSRDVARPVKSCAYLQKRYLEHPHYAYSVYGILRKTVPQGMLVVRNCRASGANAVRVVDYIGADEGLVGLGRPLISLLALHQAEYLDFYNFGMDPDLLATAGFLKRAPRDSVIVPNYFEPFERRNVDIHFAWKSKAGAAFRLFKGDSDQDRPNEIPIRDDA